MTDAPDIDFDKGEGLVPAIVQDAATRQVLMLGYMNRDAFTRTLETGQVTFFSRSKNRLWTKGETSGNTLSLVSIRSDCDRDTLLVEARPAGPACHTGSVSCFDDGDAPGLGFLARLSDVIASRRDTDPSGSYVAKLLAAGPQRMAQKVGEEGVETALAAVSGDIADLTGEAADLVFHLLVLLEGKGVGFDTVIAELRRRHAEAVSPPQKSSEGRD
ncbi:bifunctional phosphoribosyl-AMP cyclohydrolase/phosphoribosyl-ATP diphosphatase HisIE [Hyphobacterium marinum]|uniref:Histidine biosynthesis bifunctional protein HisIE n=1 Tax=Hyphobacterium marinum TaxID=3116574 RepID=A0ABU7LYV0_9PROT|nr:bifunctional phosphoribosyl-AMP cyclohydrolase/phosphoribosyl-ATP diphosphatase HisIE [Hyphobacterium sp. Y6023]MEE2566736.1 bifunctional phosphoribosyl-AMP cyclohydrolase/phosphoribosyl-ATP diphosphatase HisIE [Hyphobacterium sp. Y6023]